MATQTLRVVDTRKDLFTKYIGRAQRSQPFNKWGNPFKVGVDGRRGECVELYREWICRGEGRHLLRDLGELEGGHVLGCWCAPAGGVTKDDPWVCHGQVLLALLDHRRKVIERKANA